MRKLFSARRRYALACLVAVAGLVTAAAQCAPPKEPPKEPPPTTIFSIEPSSWDFGTTPSTKLFTVTNNGPDTSGTIATELSGPDAATNFEVAPAGMDNTCKDQTLAAGDTCEVKVAFNTSDAGPKEADLVVNSDNPDDGEAVAKLTGTA